MNLQLSGLVNIPVIDKIGAKMNMMETVTEVPSQEVITKDNAMIQVDGIVFFQVLNAAKAAYEVNRLSRAILIQTDAPTLNRRGQQYVGRVFTLSEAIVNGVGKIKVDDTLWKVKGKDTEVGKRVRVTEVDGVVLLVESVD